MDFILVLIIILGSSQLLGTLATKLGLPKVIGQLMAGLLIGPAMLNWVHLNNTIQDLANLGVVVLMFIAGLHSDIHLLRKYLTPSLIIAMTGIILPIVMVMEMAILMSWSFKDATFLGLIFGATSVSITVAVLKEMRQLRSKEGSTILGAAVADDIMTVVLLGLVVTAFGVKLGHQITAGLNISLVILIQFLYLALIYLIAKKIIIPGMNRITKNLSMINLSMMALIICLIFSEVAELIGLSAITGAFFAGLAINPTPVKQKINSNLEALGELFLIPIFFTSIGLEMNWQGLVDKPLFILLLIILAMLGKLFGAGLGAKLMHFNFASSFIIGAGMISRGEVGLIIAQIVYKHHLINNEQYSAIIAALIITTIIAPVILKAAIKRKHSFDQV